MQLISDLWSQAKAKLALQILSQGEFHLIRIDENSPIPSYCGIDESNRQFIAFRTINRPNIPTLKTEAFDSITTQRPDKSWLYILRLVDQKLASVFESLCIDLASEIIQTKNEDTFFELIKRRVKSWQKLFASTDNGTLRKNQIIGLIGELVILVDLIRSNTKPLASAVVAWQGPYGSDQDFIFSDEAIETKTLRDDILEVGISSLEQLNIEQVPKIALAVLSYRNIAANDPVAISLNSIVAIATQLCVSDPLSFKNLNYALLEAGYVQNKIYDETCIAIVKKEIYNVDHSFPKLTPQSVSIGVIKASYSISLLQIASHKIAEYPYGYD
jgi:hypothetical protein